MCAFKSTTKRIPPTIGAQYKGVSSDLHYRCVLKLLAGQWGHFPPESGYQLIAVYFAAFGGKRALPPGGLLEAKGHRY